MFSIVDPQNFLNHLIPLRSRRPPNLPSQSNSQDVSMNNSRQQSQPSAAALSSRLSHDRSNNALSRLPLSSRTSSHPAPQRDSNSNLLRKPHLPHIHHHLSNPNPPSATNGLDRERPRDKPPQEQQQQQQQMQQDETQQSQHHHRSRRHRHSTTHAHRHRHQHQGVNKGVPQSASATLKSPSWTELLKQRDEEMGTGADGTSIKDEVLERWKTENRREGLVRVDDVERERGKGRRREEELRSTLQSLTTLSHAATRRLDTTYYALLDKLSLLRSTIANLQELSSATLALRDDFDANSQALHRDIRAKIEEFGPAAETQEKQIRRLEERLGKSKEVATGLGRRVEQARERVRRWEEGEREWQARISRRLRLLLGCLGAVAVLLIVLAAFHAIGPKGGKIAESVRSTEAEVESDVAAVFSMLPVNLEDIKSRASNLGLLEDPADADSVAQTTDWVDERMRVVEEL